MIEKMTRYSFVLPAEEKESFLEALQELGFVDITRSEKPVDENTSALLARIEAQRIRIAEIEQGCDPELKALQAETARLEAEAATLSHWGEYDRGKLLGAGLPIHFYCLPEKQFRKVDTSSYALQVVEEDGNTVYFVIVGDNAGFPAAELPVPDRTASEARKEAAAKKAEAETYAQSLCAQRSELPALRETMHKDEQELARALAGATAEDAVEGTVALLTGYAPSDCESRLDPMLDRSHAVYLKQAAAIGDNPPIKLRNNWFVRQFEVLTQMYGSPAYDEFDPTPILGPFFLLFFALCMGDAGYGLLLIAIGWLIGKKVPSMASFSPLVMMLGGATFVVGIVLHTFFGINLHEAAWVPDWLKTVMITGQVAGYDAQMVLAIGIGVFHICLAMVVKAVCYTRKDGFLQTLGTWGWTLLIVGGVILAGIAFTGVIDRTVTKWAVIILGAVSACGIFLFNKPGRNPLLNIGAGLWDSYNTATGLLGDVLSYLRLFALGMAGGMLGQTFNMLAGMVLDAPVPGVNWLGFLIILLIGHGLNLALSCLGAFVHPLRLTFVEYFKNSGYQGTGRAYKPLK